MKKRLIPGRMMVFNDVMDWTTPDSVLALSVGDTVPAIRGNGPREGDQLGWATVTKITEDGPVIQVEFTNRRTLE